MTKINNGDSGLLARTKINDAIEMVDISSFLNAAAVIADTGMTYSTVAAGDVVRTREEGFSYQVAASGASDHNLTTAGGVKLYVLPDASGVSVAAFGAVGNGVADDLPAFNLAEAEAVSPVKLSSAHYLSTDTTSKNASYYLTSAASVTLGAGSWNPRRYYKDGVTPFDRKVNFSASNPSVPPQNYAFLADSYQQNMFWINQWGYQEPDTLGNYSGSSNGPFPPGQTRLARTGSQQINLTGQHSGQGDGYNIVATMVVTPSGASPITFWSGQNSGGVLGHQVNAIGAKVNLYGLGDLVLDDKGFQDVALLGNVSILYRDGANSGSYNVPRFNYLSLSSGANDVDAAYIAKGKYTVGLDLSQVEASSNFAIALLSGQRIGFDAPAVASGKFSASGGGNYYIHKSGSKLELVSNSVAIGQAYSDRFEVRPGADGAFSFRVYGASSTAFFAAGQAGAVTIIQAASSGSDSTTLAFRTANAGVEADALSINSSGVVNIAQATGRLQINGTQVLTTRRTGWTAPTGTATRTSFDTATVTTAQLAERVKGLIDDLIAHGLIGA